MGGEGGDGILGLGERLGEGLGEGLGGGLTELLGSMVVLDALPGPAFWLLLICPCKVEQAS